MAVVAWAGGQAGAPPSNNITSAIIILVTGDSNGYGSATDEGDLYWASDPGIRTMNVSGQFVTYAPNSITGINLNGNLDHGHVGPEAQFARLYRYANPTTAVYIVKTATPGATQNSTAGTYNWTPGSLPMTNTKTRLDNTKTLLASLGLPIDHIYNLASIGINDATSTYRLLYSQSAADMYEDIKANWLRDARDMIIQYRVTNNNSSAPTIRYAQQANTKDVSQVKLVDTDGFGKNADVTHYNLSGQINCGAAAYAVAIGGASLNLDLFPADPFNDNSRGWILAAGWTISGGLMNASSVAAFGTSGLDNALDRAGATYRISYDLVVTSGSARVQIIGATTVTGATRTASGSYTEDLVAPAANSGALRINVAAAGIGLTGSIDNFRIQRL